jgi:hypothetical protein
VARSATFTLVAYVLAVAFVPSIAFWATFAATCAVECTALPWLSMIAGPGLGILAVVVLAILTYRRAGQFEEGARRRVRFAVLSSILWGWPIAYCVFGMSLPLAQELS